MAPIRILSCLHLIALFVPTLALRAQTPLRALPAVDAPFAGDARLEPIPAKPMHLASFPVFGDGKRLQMRFPPRVNGQTYSDGDNHSDLLLFFDEVSGLPIPGQLPVVEAVPKGAAPNVSDLIARLYSAIWEVTVVTVASNYDPSDPAIRIDSLLKVLRSPYVRRLQVTNMFLNCPVVPMGTTADPGAPPHEQAWFDGTPVQLAPYDVEDGVSHAQVMFKFVDPKGNTLPSASAPHLVLSHIPGEPFYSSIWEVWTVTVPAAFPVQDIRSLTDVKNSNLPITSAHIRLNCPVVAVETGQDSGSFTPIHFEDAFALVRNDFQYGVGRFNPDTFRMDLPTGASLEVVRNELGEPIGLIPCAAPFAKSRTLQLVFTELPPFPLDPPLVGLATQFPRIATAAPGEAGPVNFVPVIQQRPFALTPPSQWRPSSGPDNTGPVIRLTQAELDAARQSQPPQLPAAIEQNIAGFIAGGLMNRRWAPGNSPYIERLALVGQALHELVWSPEQGVQSIDTTSCVACHSLPASGGASRGLYTLVQESGDFGHVIDTINGGSMWGSGAQELLVLHKRAQLQPVTLPHGATGDRDTIRHFVSKAQNAHFGIQSAENVAEQARVSIAAAATIDLDNDGVTNEVTVGEVTAQAAFLLSLPPPDAAEPDMLSVLGIAQADVDQGRALFTRSIGNGGVGCAACHTPFHRMPGTTLQLRNPETTSILLVPLEVHTALQSEVDDGYATLVGEEGLRTYGDFKLHRVGPLMRSAGIAGPELVKTAELWDVGSTFPLLRDGSKGSDLRAVILAHQGLVRPDITIQKVALSRINESRALYSLRVRNTSALPVLASPSQPLRIVVTSLMPPMATAENVAGLAPDGSAREGAFWTITQPLLPGATITLPVSFRLPGRLPMQFEVVAADATGYSEAIATARAFARLGPQDQQRLVDFLRAQLIGGPIGE